jgi:GT2 family glycosyltransferase
MESPVYEEFVDTVARRIVAQQRRPGGPKSSAWLYRAIRDAATRFDRPRQEIADAIYARSSTLQPIRDLHEVARLFQKAMFLASCEYHRLIANHLHGISPTAVTAPPARPLPRTSDRRATIVVLTYNRVGYLETTIKSLHATTRADSFELIAVDNGSSDGAAERLREMVDEGLIHKLVLRRKNHGTSPGFNCGFAYADPRSDFVVKLDSDIKVLTPGWLDRFAQIFASNPDIGVLSLDQVNIPQLRMIPIERRGDASLKSWSYHVIGGSCMTIPRRILEEVGFFSEDFEEAYMPDDIDYYTRVSRLGYEAYYVTDCRSFHRRDLDTTSFRSDESKKDVARVVNLGHYRRVRSGYDAGTRPLRITYPHYEHLTFPPGERIIEID